MTEPLTLPDLLRLAHDRGSHEGEAMRLVKATETGIETETDEACPSLERVAAAAAGDASWESRSTLLAHASTCPACAAELEVAARLGLGPGNVPSIADASRSEGEIRRIEARLASGAWRTARPAARLQLAPAEERVAPTPQPAAHLRPRWLAAAAALFAAGLGAGWWLATTGPPPLPEPSQSTVLRGSTLRLEAPLGDIDEAPRQFSWSPIAEAREYELRILAVDGRTLAVRRIEAPATEHKSVTHPLSDTPSPEDGISPLRFEPRVRYEWLVTALDESGAPLVVSPASSFRVRPEPGR